MKIILAFDSFKGCLSATEINRTAAQAIAKILPGAQIVSLALADGGEGTLDALVAGANGQQLVQNFSNLEHQQRPAALGVIQNTCIIEVAQTVGLPQSNRQQVEFKTTQGIGEQLKFALNLGYRHFAIGLGGSGTNDAGVGMLAALGYKFLDAQRKPVQPTLANLAQICALDDRDLDPRLQFCEFTLLSDVKNPLYGPNGATYVYGPQKGLLAAQLVVIDAAIASFSQVARQHFKHDYAQQAGAGAAGGLGYAFLQFLRGTLVSGVDYVLEKLNAAIAIQTADVIFTGEGRSDGQTAQGKVAVGVAQLAKRYQKPVILISGALSEEAYQLHDYGIDSLSSIQDYPTELAHALQPTVAQRLLAHRIEESLRLVLLGRNLKG